MRVFPECLALFRSSREKKLSALQIQQNSVIPLGNSKVKNQDPWKFHMSFSLNTPGNFASFLTDPLGISTFSFFNTPENSMSSSPLFSFFSGIAQYQKVSECLATGLPIFHSKICNPRSQKREISNLCWCAKCKSKSGG